MQLSVTKFYTLLMKFSRIKYNSAPAALAIAQDIYKKDHFCITIEKNDPRVKIKPK